MIRGVLFDMDGVLVNNTQAHGKSQRFFFLAKIQALANFRSLIGNDLETSEILYFTSFCSNSKERFS